MDKNESLSKFLTENVEKIENEAVGVDKSANPRHIIKKSLHILWNNGQMTSYEEIMFVSMILYFKYCVYVVNEENILLFENKQAYFSDYKLHKVFIPKKTMLFVNCSKDEINDVIVVGSKDPDEVIDQAFVDKFCNKYLRNNFVVRIRHDDTESYMAVTTKLDNLKGMDLKGKMYIGGEPV